MSRIQLCFYHTTAKGTFYCTMFLLWNIYCGAGAPRDLENQLSKLYDNRFLEARDRCATKNYIPEKLLPAEEFSEDQRFVAEIILAGSTRILQELLAGFVETQPKIEQHDNAAGPPQKVNASTPFQPLYSLNVPFLAPSLATSPVQSDNFYLRRKKEVMLFTCLSVCPSARSFKSYERILMNAFGVGRGAGGGAGARPKQQSTVFCWRCGSRL